MSLLVLVARAAPPAADPTVARVVDGDTVVLKDGERVRLLAIDTPERGEPYYREAGEYLASLVANRKVRLQFSHRRRDAYHRLLAHLWLGDTLVAEVMLASGLARFYPWQDDTLHHARLLTAQTAARRAKRALWSLPAPEPESVYVIREIQARFHRPGCTAVRPQHSRTHWSRERLLDSGWAACRTCRP